MRNSLFTICILVLFGCSNNSAVVEQIEETNKLLSEDIEQMGTQIARTVDEYGIDEEPTIMSKAIVSEYSRLDKLIATSTSKSKLNELILNWRIRIDSIFSSDVTLNVNNSLGLELAKTFAKHELRFKTIRVLNELLESIIPPDPKFNQITLVFVPEIQELKLGETYRGKVFFGALLNKPETVVDFYMNNKLLELEDGGALVVFRPNSRGQHTIKVEARGKSNSQITRDLKFENSFSFNVK
ncbi:MAG: hypothetical protein JXR10_13185 [Cyclobacteriaceae bacterium]